MEHPVFGISSRAFTRWEAWCWLLDRAAYRDGDAVVRGRKMSLRVGDIATSLGALGDVWKWPRSSVRRFLTSLEKAEFITQRLEHRGGTVSGTHNGTPNDATARLLSICDYNKNPNNDRRSSDACGTPPGTDADPTNGAAPYKLDSKEDNKRRKRDLPKGDRRQPDLLGAQVISMPPDEVKMALEAYMTAARELGLRLPRGGMSAERRAALRRQLRTVGLSRWEEAMIKLREAEWITSKGWRSFSIDHLANPDTFERLLAGDFDVVFGRQQQETTWERERREYLESGGENSLYRGMKGGST